MRNKIGSNTCLMAVACLMLACAFQGQAGPSPAATTLTSTDEAERFGALESLQNGKVVLTDDQATAALSELRPKNVSTLLFWLMESGSDLVYRLEAPARNTAETAEGAFPNIAFYYARIRPEEGLTSLLRLYSERPDQRMTLCKAIGETGLPRAREFLIREMSAEKPDLIPLLAGYRFMTVPLAQRQVKTLLSRSLGRDELVALAKAPADFSDAELRSLFAAGDAATRFYVTETVFFRPDVYLAPIETIVADLMQKGDIDAVRRLMMSDGIRRSRDAGVREYRDQVLKKIGNPS